VTGAPLHLAGARRCRLCASRLSTYHPTTSDICALCESRLSPLHHEGLTAVVTGLLLIEWGRHGRAAQLLDLRDALERLGISSTARERNEAVRKARRRRVQIDAAGEDWHRGPDGALLRGYRPTAMRSYRKPRSRSTRTPRRCPDQLVLFEAA